MMGKINKVRIVAVTNPPITTIASGLEDSDPIPVEIAAGSNPMAANVAVITTGLMRAITPERMARSRCIRSWRFFLNFDNKITLFWIQIPKRAINPIPAEMPKLMQVRCSANIPQKIANGSFSRISPASITLPNRMNRMKKIKTRLMGTTTFNCLEARCRFSKSPSHEME